MKNVKPTKDSIEAEMNSNLCNFVIFKQSAPLDDDGKNEC